MDVSVSGTINQRKYLKKFRGGFSPLSPSRFAYAEFFTHLIRPWVLFLSYIPFVVNYTFNTMPTEGLQHLQQVWARLGEMTEGERDK